MTLEFGKNEYFPIKTGWNKRLSLYGKTIPTKKARGFIILEDQLEKMSELVLNQIFYSYSELMRFSMLKQFQKGISKENLEFYQSFEFACQSLKKCSISMKFPKKLDSLLKSFCAENGLSYSAFLRYCLEEELSLWQEESQ